MLFVRGKKTHDGKKDETKYYNVDGHKSRVAVSIVSKRPKIKQYE